MNTNQNKKEENNFFMKLALQQAQNNLGNTKDNPSVGCVIVKNGNALGVGNTSKNGRPHAETNAINFSRETLKKSDIYITLEPCSNYGKTNPCVHEIAKKRFKKVYFSVNDPDPRSYKKSLKYLKKKDIKVKSGTLHSEVKNFYKSYFSFKEKKMPFVTGKIALSKDLYSTNKKKKWITNIFSRGRVHLLRSFHDCILTSAKTIIIDNPNLDCRINGLEKLSPSRFIIDKNLSIPVRSKIIKSAKKHRTYIIYNRSNKKKISLLKNSNVKMIKMSINELGNFDLRKVLFKIGKLGFSRIFLETGLNLFTNFLKNRLINDLYIFVSNKKIGKNGYNSFKKYMKKNLNNKSKQKQRVNLFGDQMLLYRMK